MGETAIHSSGMEGQGPMLRTTPSGTQPGRRGDTAKRDSRDGNRHSTNPTRGHHKAADTGEGGSQDRPEQELP
eukprot:1764643-Rhodomonas_salina.2